jgi:hypothetical protein
LKHSPPRIDHFGYNKIVNIKPGEAEGYNILKHVEKIRLPDGWGKVGEGEDQAKTRTKLLDKRQADKMPNISYDLDGDGYVGGRDLVISKVFDKGQKGHLTGSERKNALEAVKGGLEHQYQWGVEVCGAKRPFRLM